MCVGHVPVGAPFAVELYPIIVFVDPTGIGPGNDVLAILAVPPIIPAVSMRMRVPCRLLPGMQYCQYWQQ